MENLTGTVFIKKEVKKSEKEDGKSIRESMATPLEDSSYVTSLLRKYNLIMANTQNSGATLKVGSSLSSVAFFYERLRNMVDYRGDHTILRNAIERISKRLLWENPAVAANTLKLSEDLIKELIWARYLKNDTFEVFRIEEISGVYSKYLSILDRLSESKRTFFGNKWRDWIMGVASSEVEEIINPKLLFYESFVEAVSAWFLGRYKITDSNLSESEKQIQAEIAVYRSLFRSDLPCVRHFLLKKNFPEWHKKGVVVDDVISSNFVLYAREVEINLQNKNQTRLYRFVQKQVPPFLILLDMFDKSSDFDFVESRGKLVEKIEEICQEKYREIAKNISTGITRSVIYIFATKVVFALLVEIPYDLFVDGALKVIPMAINLVFPPVLMFGIGMMIKKPSSKNTKKIESVISDFVYDERQETVAEFSLIEKSKRGFMYTLFIYLYMALFAVVFGLISYVLYRLHFSVISAAIFFGFLSLVMLFGFRVKHNSSRLNMEEGEDGFLASVVSVVTLPFLNVGVWLSSQLARINFLLVIFDFLIEAPLKSILSILEEWGVFMKEKKDEIIEAPS